jgi:PKD repeat protein
MMKTVWTMDANSRIYGTLNTFGNPRMQIAGTPFTADWFEVESSEVTSYASMMREFGPAWLTTEDFLKVNDMSYDASGYFSVDLEELEGSSLEYGANPVATMTTHYTSDLVFKKGSDIKVEVFSILDEETIEIILPANYEILGEFGDKAEFIDDNTSKIRVFEPIEFNAKEKERPEAKLRFVNSYDFYRVEPDVYIVKIDENITLTAEDSVDPVGSIEKYIWKNLPGSIVIWDEDKEDFVAMEEMDLSTMEKFTFQFTANSNDFYNITLNVQDSSMLRSEMVDWIHLMPDNKAPTVEDYTMIYLETGENLTMEGEMYLADEDLEIEFNATSAKDGENGVIVDYVWTFGDDTPAVNGDVVVHRFTDPGTFNVTLKIVDAVENEVELLNHTTIKVSDTTKPMSVIKPFPDTDQGDSVEMNASQSYDPRSTGNLEEDIVAWTWTKRAEGQNWTVQEEFGTQKVFNYTFTEPGTYIINLTVTDKTGLTGYVEKILLVSGPDLQIMGVTFSDPDENNLREKEETTLSIAYSNAGTVDINATWKIVIKDNTKVVKEHDVVGVIKAGDTMYYNTTYELKAGARNFEVILDFDDVVKEMSDENNNFETSVDVKDAPSIIKWWYVAIALLIVLIGYVVYMKYTRGEWGYEPIQRWWERRNS